MIKKIMLFIASILFIGIVKAEHALPTDLVNDSSGLLVGIGNWASSVTYGAYWVFILLAFCIVMFISTTRYGNVKAFGFASATGLFGSMILLIIGWIHWTIASMFIITGAIGIVIMYKSKE